MQNAILLESIKQLCPENQYIVGFADLHGLLPSRWHNYPYGISLARKLDDAIIDQIVSGPTIQYFHLYHSVNDELNRKTAQIVSRLLEAGIEAIAIPSTVNDSDMKLDAEYHRTLRYVLSHKMVATRAGIGWIGKTDLLVTHRFGPRVRLSSILMSSPLADMGQPIDESLCGSCTVCVTHCPVHAANGMAWSIYRDRNEFFDPFRCMKYCREISAERIQKDISICGICVSVCPRGKIA